MNIIGYDFLGVDSVDGIRYAWQCDQYTNYVESAAFINRSKGVNENVCGYTTSVSAGCILRHQGMPCSFCRTGNVLPFGRLLTYKEITLQNVFMVLTDIVCDDHPELKEKEREFAYMGQGEPGYSYTQVRKAIELTNDVMEELGQKVCRHVFATCGIPEAIECYKNDLKNYFTKRVTLHLSLHSYTDRDVLMPVNKLYPIEESISLMKDIQSISGEKPCIGILLFNHFSSKSGVNDYTNHIKNIESILSLLNPENFRLSFCEYNPISEISVSEQYPSENIQMIMDKVRNEGYEAKFFSSFGREKQSACGMLGGKKPDHLASNKWALLYERTKKMIDECSK